jgi:hypothetical protein
MKLPASARPLLRSLSIAWVLALGGCAPLAHRDAIEGLSQFRPLPQSSQVRYAPGARAFAERVAALLPEATAQVEATHYRAFDEPPVVYVCGEAACFHRYVDARWNFTAAVVYDNRLLLGPRLFEREPQRLLPILLHELSHLHMGQLRGHYSVSIPVWFHEGLASFTAHGGGADLATDAQAWTAAGSERHFLPDEQHLPWQGRRMADSWRLPVSVFYRQALIFVRSLHARDPDAFRRFVTSLQQGADFDAAFAEAYQANPARAAAALFASGPAAARTPEATACIAAADCGAHDRPRHAQR